MSIRGAIAGGFLGRAGSPARSSATPAGANPMPVPYLDTRSALGLSAVWRCVTLIADLIADMPWTEWRGDDQLEPSRLVRRPMATMTRREWTWRVVATEALYNAVHLLHVGGTDGEGAPWSLLPVAPEAISPSGRSDPWAMLPPAAYNIAGREISDAYVTVARRAPFPGVADYMAGILSVARRQFSSYLAADVAAARYWQAGGPITTVLTTEQELTPDEAEEIAQRWVDRRSLGADYPAVLGKGAEAKPWGADPASEAAVAVRQEINADVGRYFGVPTRILNAPAGDSETYSNVENDAVDLLRYCLRGYMGPIEDAISELLPGDYLAGRRMRFDATATIQGDLATRATAYVALTGGGILTIPEARVRGFGLTPAPAATPAPSSEAVASTVTATIR